MDIVAYWAHTQVSEKMKCCEYDTRDPITTLHFLWNLCISL